MALFQTTSPASLSTSHTQNWTHFRARGCNYGDPCIAQKHARHLRYHKTTGRGSSSTNMSYGDYCFALVVYPLPSRLGNITYTLHAIAAWTASCGRWCFWCLRSSFVPSEDTNLGVLCQVFIYIYVPDTYVCINLVRYKGIRCSHHPPTTSLFSFLYRYPMLICCPPTYKPRC